MKDKYDLYMEMALKPTIEPNEELNSRIIAASKKKESNKVLYIFAKAAVAVIVFAIVAPTAAYATEIISEKIFVTEHSISTGSIEDVNDELFVSEEEEVKIEELESEEGDSSVNWLTKKVQLLNDYVTNTYYTYDTYEKALADAGHENWFDVTYETQISTYVLSEAEDFTIKSVDSELIYLDHTFHVSQNIITGNMDIQGSSIQLQNSGNVRNYVSPSGNQFVLVDEVRSNGIKAVTRTITMIKYGEYYGYLYFEDYSEDEIHSILDTICIEVEF